MVEFGENVKYFMSFEQIRHDAIDWIHILIGSHNNKVYLNFDLVSGIHQGAAFADLLPTLRDNLNDLETDGNAHLTERPRLVIWRTWYNYTDESQLPITLGKLVQTVLAPLLTESQGCLINYEILVDCSGISNLNPDTCAVLSKHITNEKENIIDPTLTVPEFPDPAAQWQVYSRFGMSTTLQTRSIFQNE